MMTMMNQPPFIAFFPLTIWVCFQLGMSRRKREWKKDTAGNGPGNEGPKIKKRRKNVVGKPI